jgi:hypothetical protein
VHALAGTRLLAGLFRYESVGLSAGKLCAFKGALMRNLIVAGISGRLTITRRRTYSAGFFFTGSACIGCGRRGGVGINPEGGCRAFASPLGQQRTPSNAPSFARSLGWPTCSGVRPSASSACVIGSW